VALEIKSAKTFNEEMTDGLKSWQKISTETNDRILLYAGSQRTSFKGIKLMPWRDVAEMK